MPQFLRPVRVEIRAQRKEIILARSPTSFSDSHGLRSLPSREVAIPCKYFPIRTKNVKSERGFLQLKRPLTFVGLTSTLQGKIKSTTSTGFSRCLRTCPDGISSVAVPHHRWRRWACHLPSYSLAVVVHKVNLLRHARSPRSAHRSRPGIFSYHATGRSTGEVKSSGR